MKHRTYAIAAAITAIVIASATAATAQNLPEGLSGTPSKLSATGKGYEIIIIDGRVATNDDLTALNPAKITKFRLYKGYGLRKEYGIIATCTKKRTQSKGTAGPIILVNGIEIDSLQQIRQRYVRTVKSIMPEKATEIYGKHGSNGAILFTLHESCDGKPITMQEVLSGYEEPAPAEPSGPDTAVFWIRGISSSPASEKAATPAKAAKPAGPDTVQIRISDISSTATPAKAAQPLTLGRAEGDETIYLIPDLNKIRPGDIASVTVFKDKSAHTFDIYGDTSGGVLLVTFKKGRIPLPAVVETGKR